MKFERPPLSNESLSSNSNSTFPVEVSSLTTLLSFAVRGGLKVIRSRILAILLISALLSAPSLFAEIQSSSPADNPILQLLKVQPRSENFDAFSAVTMLFQSYIQQIIFSLFSTYCVLQRLRKWEVFADFKLRKSSTFLLYGLAGILLTSVIYLLSLGLFVVPFVYAYVCFSMALHFLFFEGISPGHGLILSYRIATSSMGIQRGGFFGPTWTFLLGYIVVFIIVSTLILSPAEFLFRTATAYAQSNSTFEGKIAIFSSLFLKTTISLISNITLTFGLARFVAEALLFSGFPLRDKIKELQK